MTVTLSPKRPRGYSPRHRSFTGNLVQGNFIGTDSTGSVTDPDGTPGSGDELGNISDGVFISSAPGNTIGGTDAGAGNVISGSGAAGVEIYDVGATGNYIQGNMIGTDVDGTDDLGNTADGVYINNAPSNIVGGVTTSARNVISGNGNSGVSSREQGLPATSFRNPYGTNALGTGDLGNEYDGVRAGANSVGTSVGGTVAGAGNIIGYNGGDGVMVDRSVNNAILGNSIFSNAGIPATNPLVEPPLSYGLGIDLVSAGEGAGVTLNDSLGHSGGNNYQNFPVLTSATSGTTKTVVHGIFNSTPSTNNSRLEFFSNSTCNQPPTGYPRVYLRSLGLRGGRDVPRLHNRQHRCKRERDCQLRHLGGDNAWLVHYGYGHRRRRQHVGVLALGPASRAPTRDSDGIPDDDENCPFVANTNQTNIYGRSQAQPVPQINKRMGEQPGPTTRWATPATPTTTTTGSPRRERETTCRAQSFAARQRRRPDSRQL